MAKQQITYKFHQNSDQEIGMDNKDCWVEVGKLCQ
jgi:hypothetical protein